MSRATAMSLFLFYIYPVSSTAGSRKGKFENLGFQDNPERSS